MNRDTLPLDAKRHNQQVRARRDVAAAFLDDQRLAGVSGETRGYCAVLFLLQAAGTALPDNERTICTLLGITQRARWRRAWIELQATRPPCVRVEEGHLLVLEPHRGGPNATDLNAAPGALVMPAREMGPAAQLGLGFAGVTHTPAPQHRPACPHSKIIAAYNRLCTGLPPEHAHTTTKSHLRWLRARWCSHQHYQSMEFWNGFFARVGRIAFLNGTNNLGFTAYFGWLVKEEHFNDILRGKYDRLGAGPHKLFGRGGEAREFGPAVQGGPDWLTQHKRLEGSAR